MLSVPILTALLMMRVGWASNFSWTFTQGVSQCQMASVTVSGGNAPWQLSIIPIFGVPIFWTLGDDSSVASSASPLRFEIPVALTPGTEFVTILDSVPDASWNENGNPYPIQTVASSADSSCLAGSVITPQQFNFNIGGNTAQCELTSVYWNDVIGAGPYWVTIIPLDASHSPFDLQAGNTNEGSYLFPMPLVTGTYFTVMVSNGNGLGTGGTGGIYRVGYGSDSSCVRNPGQATSSWPVDEAPATVGPLIASVPLISGTRIIPVTTDETTPQVPSVVVIITTVPITPSSTSSSGQAVPTFPPAKKSNSALIGGAAGGGAAGVAIIACLAWFCVRRRRRASSADGHQHAGYIDSGYRTYEHDDKVVPYPATDVATSNYNLGNDGALPVLESRPMSAGQYSGYTYGQTDGPQTLSATPTGRPWSRKEERPLSTASGAGASSEYTQAPFVLHSDAANVEEAIHLPPTYHQASGGQSGTQ